MKVFISHSSSNSDVANGICEFLEKNNHSCFIAPRDIRPGYEYASEILYGIDNSQVVLLLLSKEANDSPHVLREVERAVSRKIPLLIHQLEEVALSSSLEYFLMTHQWIDTSENKNSDILKHINALENSNTSDNNATIDEVNTETTKSQSTMSADENALKKAVFFPLSIIVLITACVFLINTIGNLWDKYANKDSGDDKEAVISTNSPNAADTNTGDSANVSVGDIVTFGKYNGADIDWYVVNVSKDNKATLVSKHIISFKGYSVPESEQYNYDNGTSYYGIEDPIADNYELKAYVRGNSSWEASAIRQWLNSDKEVVSYTGKTPEDKVFAELANGYDIEAGFLYNFSKEERASIVETNVTTGGNVLSPKETVTKDKVFLLSKDELSWLTDAGISLYATVTAEAAAQEETNFYKNYCEGINTETARYWLREPVAEDSSTCYQVGNSDCKDLTIGPAGISTVGIRPALIVDLTKNTIKVK